MFQQSAMAYLAKDPNATFTTLHKFMLPSDPLITFKLITFLGSSNSSSSSSSVQIAASGKRGQIKQQ